MTAKKSDSKSSSKAGEKLGQAMSPADEIEERKRRREEATTVDGTESFPPAGMDLPDGGVVPASEDSPAL